MHVFHEVSVGEMWVVMFFVSLLSLNMNCISIFPENSVVSGKNTLLTDPKYSSLASITWWGTSIADY